MSDNARRDWCFTAWRKPEFDESKCKYVCWGIERCPTTDREHYQGYICLTRTCRINSVKRIIGAGDDTHVEPRRGTRDQARDYTRKDGGEIFEWGIYERLSVAELLKQPISKIKEENLMLYLRYHRGLEKLQLCKGNAFRDVLVYIYYSNQSGVGKTRKVMEMDDVYKLDPPYTWWDGYEGQKRLLLDDYRLRAIPKGQLLNILDGYQLRLETKGSHAWAAWTEVYITTNTPPERIMEDAAVRRRVTATECFDICDA